MKKLQSFVMFFFKLLFTLKRYLYQVTFAYFLWKASILYKVTGLEKIGFYECTKRTFICNKIQMQSLIDIAFFIKLIITSFLL